MPALSNHQSQRITKMLLIGNSGSGKTSALASLARAGYNLRIIDADAGTDILFNLLRDDPAAMERVIYELCQDKMKSVNGQAIPDGIPGATKKALGLMTHWKMPETKGTDGVVYPAYDLGPISAWGSKDILVIDSLTHFSIAALRYCRVTMPSKDGRMDYYNAQQIIEGMLGLLCSDAIKCNVIVISHITYIGEEGNQRGYPAAIGSALSARIGSYFNTCLQVATKGFGANTKRMIYTQPIGDVDIKNSAPIGMPKEFGIENGLAEFFAHVRGEIKQLPLEEKYNV